MNPWSKIILLNKIFLLYGIILYGYSYSCSSIFFTCTTLLPNYASFGQVSQSPSFRLQPPRPLVDKKAHCPAAHPLPKAATHSITIYDSFSPSPISPDMSNLNSWEDDPAAQDDNLSRQAQQLDLNNQPQPQAGSFRPGANSFQPGAQSFQPGQNFQQYGGGYDQSGGYQNQYNQGGYQAQGYGGGGYPQYGGQQQAYNNQQYPQYNQQQGGYNQQYCELDLLMFWDQACRARDTRPPVSNYNHSSSPPIDFVSLVGFCELVFREWF